MESVCAISTPYGIGGIAVIRVSGERAIPISEAVLGSTLSKQVSLVRIPDLDDVVVTTYHAPHSFTGEDVVEISCHGSLFIQQELLRRLIDNGCRMAQGGEFTKRAFLNGKMDLVQAEAVADLIAAETKAEKDLALQQLRGGLSDDLASLRQQLLTFTSLIELELDFADHEELEFADRSELNRLAAQIEQHLLTLTESFQTGNAIKNGIPVAIIGPANAGKSTLLNALIGEERAIVSDIAGTTRDTIEERLIIDGTLFRIIDTAGLRDSDDTIEKLGIERSRQAMDKAAIILYVQDCRHLQPFPDDPRIIRVYNKIDLTTDDEIRNSKFGIRNSDDQTPHDIFISAKRGAIQPLMDRLKQVASSYQSHPAMLSNARHYEALMRARQAISRVQQGLQANLSGELLSLDLNDCLQALGEVTGQISNQEVLNHIFTKFCIGK